MVLIANLVSLAGELVEGVNDPILQHLILDRHHDVDKNVVSRLGLTSHIKLLNT